VLLLATTLLERTLRTAAPTYNKPGQWDASREIVLITILPLASKIIFLVLLL
jgi:hypothetical protein